MKHAFTIICVVILLATGCHKRVAFTQELRTEYDLTDEQLRHIQFYTSEPITLRHNPSGKELQFEEIKMRPGTPGVVVRVDPYSLGVSFENGDYLNFGSRLVGLDGIAQNMNMYFLYVSYKNGQYGRYTLTYAGKTFTVEGDPSVYLMVDLNDIKNCKKDTRYLDGRRLP